MEHNFKSTGSVSNRVKLYQITDTMDQKEEALIFSRKEMSKW